MHSNVTSTACAFLAASALASIPAAAWAPHSKELEAQRRAGRCKAQAPAERHLNRAARKDVQHGSGHEQAERDHDND